MDITEKLREWIPGGDGYNSDFAHDMADAADEIEKLRGLLGGTDDLSQSLIDEIEQLREALRWYGDEAAALATNMAAKKDMAVLASVQVLALDTGKRANDVLLKTPNVMSTTKREVNRILD